MDDRQNERRNRYSVNSPLGSSPNYWFRRKDTSTCLLLWVSNTLCEVLLWDKPSRMVAELPLHIVSSPSAYCAHSYHELSSNLWRSCRRSTARITTTTAIPSSTSPTSSPRRSWYRDAPAARGPGDHASPVPVPAFDDAATSLDFAIRAPGVLLRVVHAHEDSGHRECRHPHGW